MEKRRFLIMAVALALSACGGGSGDSVDVSGIWHGGGTGQVDGKPVTITATVTLAQSGSNVSGTFTSSSGNTGAIVATFDGSKLVGDMIPSNPGNCPAHLIWFYSANKLEGSVTSYNCSASTGGTFTLTR